MIILPSSICRADESSPADEVRGLTDFPRLQLQRLLKQPETVESYPAFTIMLREDLEKRDFAGANAWLQKELRLLSNTKDVALQAAIFQDAADLSSSSASAGDYSLALRTASELINNMKLSVPPQGGYNSPSSLFGTTRALCKSHHYAEAEHLLKEFLSLDQKLDPGFECIGWLNLGHLHRLQSNPQTAKSDLEHCVQIAKKNGLTTMLELAQIELESADRESKLQPTLK